MTSKKDTDALYVAAQIAIASKDYDHVLAISKEISPLAQNDIYAAGVLLRLARKLEESPDHTVASVDAALAAIKNLKHSPEGVAIGADIIFDHHSKLPKSNAIEILGATLIAVGNASGVFHYQNRSFSPLLIQRYTRIAKTIDAIVEVTRSTPPSTGAGNNSSAARPETIRPFKFPSFVKK